MHQKYALFCDAASVMDNGKVALHGIFDQIYAPQVPSTEKPLTHPSMSFAFEVVDVTPNEGDLEIEIRNEKSGDLMYGQKSQYKLSSANNGKMIGIVTLPMMQITSLGKYIATVRLTGKEFAKGYFVVQMAAGV
jgi:hypothetical protein